MAITMGDKGGETTDSGAVDSLSARLGGILSEDKAKEGAAPGAPAPEKKEAPAPPAEKKLDWADDTPSDEGEAARAYARRAGRD